MSDVDGWITIGTKMDTSKFDKQYQNLAKKARDQEIKIDIQLENVKKAENQLKELDDELSHISDEKLEEAQRFFELSFKRSTGGMSKSEVEEYQALMMNAQEYEDIQKQIEKIGLETAERQNKLDLENTKLQNMKRTYNEIQQEMQNVVKAKEEFVNAERFSGVRQQLDKINSSIRRVTKQVIHWGLAIFGVRSAYLFVRQAMSTLSGYNEQLATDLQYIRFALASTLEPLIKKIVEWAYKLLQIIGTIIMTLTGYNIFKNSGADKFQKSLDKSASSAKEIKKQLAGFDEMNILNDSSSGGGAGDGNIAPSIDLSGIQKQKLPQWMLDLLDYGDQIIAILAGIAGGLLALKLGFEPLQALGIGLAIIGVVYAIENLLQYLEDPSWENFGQIIEGIGLAIIGLGLAFFGLPVAIAGVVVAIVGIIIEHWEEIKALFDKAVNWLTEKMEYVTTKYGYFAGLIVEGIRDNVKLIRDFLDNIFKYLKDILDNIIGFFKNVFTGNWKGAWQNLVNIVKDVFGIIKTVISTAFGVIKNNIKSMIGVIGDIISGIIKGAINAVFATIERRINLAIDMFNGVLSVVNKLSPVKIGKIGRVYLPRLAKGGIINYPGPGVPVGGAIAGERGAEGVIPLTDSQQMALLGEAIGKYITINATVINSMNGRVISREIQRVQNENNFAMNR